MASRRAQTALRASTSALPASRAHASGSARVSDAPAPAPSASNNVSAPLPSQATVQPTNVSSSLGADPAQAATGVGAPGPSRTSRFLYKVTRGRYGEPTPTPKPGQPGALLAIAPCRSSSRRGQDRSAEQWLRAADVPGPGQGGDDGAAAGPRVERLRQARSQASRASRDNSASIAGAW